MNNRRGALLAAFVIVIAVAAAWIAGAGTRRAAALDPLSVVVTATGDDAGATCPHVSECTLRAAVGLVNDDETGARYVITFHAGTFPAAAPATIALLGALPSVTRNLVTIDGTGTGVIISGAGLPADPSPVDGLLLTGDDAVVRALNMRGFSGRCVALTGARGVVGGSRAEGHAVSVGNCPVGIFVGGAASAVTAVDAGFEAAGGAAPVGQGIVIAGPGSVVGGGNGLGNRVGNSDAAIVLRANGATVASNDIGFDAAGEAAGVTVGILVAAGNARLGGGSAALANAIGNASVAVLVGDGGAAFSGTRIIGNMLGKRRGGQPATLGSGIELRPPSSGTVADDNTIANAAGGAITVAPAPGGPAVTGNTFRGNRFEALAALAIDLGGDGLRNPNDAGDIDDGPNGFLNYPDFTRAVQAQVTGSAGPTCAGCTVELYVAAHTPGGTTDYAATPVPGGTTTTDGDGAFVFAAPPLAPGQWVMATVTDLAGNTGEFGPSTRVGAGLVQCGNIVLWPGWNSTGFFGLLTTLGPAFPAALGLPSRVTSIYHLQDGAATFTSWFSSGPAATLTALEPGEAYWFESTQQVAIPGGFGLGVPFPIELKAGWNEFVYIGATGDVRDALASIAGQYREVYRFVNDAAGPRWLAYGRPDTPAWARAFTDMQACATYQVYVTADTVLTPLQP